MSDEFADFEAILARAMHSWRPPPKLTLSQWADRYFVLSAESAAEPGRWKTLPYQRGILDAITDPTVEQVSVMKSARVGYTKMLNATIGYFIHQDPCSVLVVQPTVEDARGYSKEELAPMLRDCPALKDIVFQDEESKGSRDSSNTILGKSYPGGVLTMVGANSGTGFRRVSRRVVAFDEVDGYPVSAGAEGDQIRLGIMRTQSFWNRKIIAGSTPLIAGTSRIERLFDAGDRRRYFVPCPSCRHMAPLVFTGEDGHTMKWPKDNPGAAYFVCQENGCIIEHHQKRDMVAGGEWRAAGEFAGHASFHIWAAYSFSANASWGQLAAEFVAAKDNPNTLQTFINTTLGETWKQQGDAPDWERLYQRREHYPIGSAPAGVRFLTAGVDVQKDRWVFEVVGWGDGKQSWSLDAGLIMGDTSSENDWLKLDELLNREFYNAAGEVLSIRCLAVDAGYNTQMVYNWARRFPMSRVIAAKGVSTARTLIGTPSGVDVTVRGKKLSKGYKIWPVGVDIAKAELYGWLKLQPPTTESAAPYPAGFCHFPEHGEEFFKQLTAEHLVSSTTRQGFQKMEWMVQPGRQNHWLDARVYARAAAAVLGLDRMRSPPRDPGAPPPVSAPAQAPKPPGPPPPRREGAWLGGIGIGNRGRDGKRWLDRKR